MNSFTELYYFLDFVERSAFQAGLKRDIFIAKTAIESICDVDKHKHYFFKYEDIEKIMNESMMYLYSRKILAKIMMWKFKENTCNLIICKCKNIFNWLYNYIYDKKKFVVKY